MNIEIREYVPFMRLKTTEKSFNLKRLHALTGGGPFTGDSNCKSLTGNVVVFWIGGGYGRWSHMEDRLC